jgi:hypothetical protein
MNPLGLLRDRRGRLLEIPILIAFACVSLAVGFGQRSWWKGPVYAALGFAAVFGALVAAVAAMERLETIPVVKRALDSRLVEPLCAGVAYLVGAVGGGALGAFVSMFAAASLADSPAGQLQVMRAVTLAGALLGAAVVSRARRAPARF